MNNFYKNKTVVITGGAGFIGTHYIQALLDKGAKVKTHTHINLLQVEDERIEVLNNIDLTKPEDCIKLVTGADYVIHSGGKIAHPSTVPTDIQISLQNIMVLGNILDACVQCNVQKFFIKYFGYGWMRRYREKLMEHVSNFSNLEIYIGRGTAIYGPNDNFNPKTCHVVPALIKRVLDNEDPFIVWGTSDVVRDFLYVKDVVKAQLLIMEEGVPMRPYNVGSGVAITVGDIVEAILKATSKTPKVVWDASKPTTIPFRMASTERIETELGFKPSYTFEEGIKETVEWYITNKLK